MAARRKKKEQDATSSAKRRAPEAPADERQQLPAMDEYRKRQAVTAAALDQLFGTWGTCQPKLWGQRTFLLLVGIVHERLSSAAEEIPTEELIALAKVLADNRRALGDARRRRAAGEVPPSLRTPSDGSARSFAEVVREIYGSKAEEPR